MSRARRKSRLPHTVNVVTTIAGAGILIAGLLLRSPVGIIAGAAAAVLGAIGIYVTRRSRD